MPYIIIYEVLVSLIAVVLTVRDKRAARSGSRRVRENTLLLVSAAGGSVAMLLTMRLIRHKTKHIKFMAGIPLIIILQIAAVVLVYRWISGRTW